MVRSALSRVMWVGRATVFLVGLAVILALLFGVVTMAFAAVAGDPFRLGQVNRINDALTTLVGSHSGAMLAIDNDSTDTKARALDLRVEPNRVPMVVNSDRLVKNLNADQVDGMHASELAPRGYAQIDHFNPINPSTGERSFIVPGSSKGVIDVVRTDDPGNVYCFDLSFVPKAAVASAHINNNATVGTTVMQSTVDSRCGTATDFEAAAVTYAANTDPSPARSDISFGIAFM